MTETQALLPLVEACSVLADDTAGTKLVLMEPLHLSTLAPLLVSLLPFLMQARAPVTGTLAHAVHLVWHGIRVPPTRKAPHEGEPVSLRGCL